MTRRFDPAEIPPSPDLRFERVAWTAGNERVGGLDEAGRGAWAGPVTAAVVVLPPGGPELMGRLAGVRDSKQMTPRQRTWWARCIREQALGWAVGWASSQEIDEIGILPSTRLAMQRALEQLPALPEHLLLDALVLPGLAIPQVPLIKGDARSLSIAAASVLAKTARDARMVELDGLHPGYGFAVHKGYGTRQHQAALANLGPCPIHRRSYAPVKAALDRMEERRTGPVCLPAK